MNEIEERLLSALRQHPYGLTISELSKNFKINRITLSKHLEVLKERGYLNYRNVGKAKVWYINEDVNFLEMIHGDVMLTKLIKLDRNSFLSIADIKFLILPSEILQVLYLQSLEINNVNFIRDVGKRFGILMATTYKMYSGVERILNEDLLNEIIKLYEKIGFGKIEEIFIDIKTLDIIINLSSSIEALILKDIEDLLKEKNTEIKEYFTEGYFEGLLSTLFGIPMLSINKKTIYNEDKTEIVIRRK
ncbi:4-vinyl reductase [Nanobdella aerobiophila]|uniref:4-vinyl reductase n=1 Tax=Nanobdella aerobiophila TaxID=2586965 RepID=A0A915SKK5_9ARCH|nr:winged helix-turn-helix domain-containing protein [Nanobdella aerobiophila]BBL45406.1 4-vinyl reductase [Nanobdella aerobiophila]